MFETALVVDDSEELLDSALRSCKKVGFEAVGKLTFAEGLSVIEDSDQLQVLITDYTLDEGSGAELVSAFQKKFPGNLAIIISGHSSDHISDKHPELNQDNLKFFEKPFSMREFRQYLIDHFGGPA